MDGNKWQELNSSTTRIGQSSQVRPAQQPAASPSGGSQPADSGSGDDRAAGLPAAAKAGLALGAVALLAIGGLVVFSGGDDDAVPAAESPDSLALADDPGEGEAVESDAVESDAVESDAVGSDGTESDGTDADADTVPVEAESEPDESESEEAAEESTDTDTDVDPVSPIGADSPPSPPGAPVTHSILADGKIYLRGTVPSEAIEGLIVAAVSEVLGEGNVVSEYVVDPSIPFDPNRSAPVYIADTVLFAPGSAEIAPDFYPLLGLGVSLIQIQPTVSIEIVGHTDAQGGDEDNLVLSQQRVDAVRTWMVAQGADGDRLVAVGKGETEPRADNSTPEGRQSNRRVEFIISGFEFG